MANHKITDLFSLLEDENENIATQAFAELLQCRDDLFPYLLEFQESPNPRLRKRVHQLQVVLSMRERRKIFSALLNSRDLHLADGLIHIHLLWFDNDSQLEIVEKMVSFSDALGTFAPRELKDLSDIMLKMGFSAEKESTLQPENYCIGNVLNRRVGTGSVICALLAACCNIEKLHVARCMGNFVLLDDFGKALIPCRNFAIDNITSGNDIQIIPTRELLKYMAVMLFSNAVNSDSFRYVLTIAQALSGAEDQSPLADFPYPYSQQSDFVR